MAVRLTGEKNISQPFYILRMKHNKIRIHLLMLSWASRLSCPVTAISVCRIGVVLQNIMPDDEIRGMVFGHGLGLSLLTLIYCCTTTLALSTSHMVALILWRPLEKRLRRCHQSISSCSWRWVGHGSSLIGLREWEFDESDGIRAALRRICTAWTSIFCP